MFEDFEMDKRRSKKLVDPSALSVIAKQIAFDIAIHMPFMYFPTFYVVKQAVQARRAATSSSTGCRSTKENWVVDQTAMVKVWLPADVVFFSGPLWLRLPLRHVVSFGWTAFVSFLRGA